MSAPPLLFRTLLVSLLATGVFGQATCRVNGVGGLCVHTSQCSGVSHRGHCPGAASIQCCIYGSCTSGAESGQCTVASMCGSRRTVSGRCPGPSSIKCCLPAVSPPASNGCTTPIDRFTGTCMKDTECTGGTFSGLCTGPSSVRCCVPPLSTPPRDNGEVSPAQFRDLFSLASGARQGALRPHFNAALSTLLQGATGRTRCLRLAAFVAQVGHESANLRYFEELATGDAYEGRSDLGNTQRGDGRRFKGRGPIQLTGRANYAAAGRDLGLDLTSRPETVAFPSVGFRTTVWFWMKNRLNTWADSASDSDFVTLTRRINGGTNGLDHRRSLWATAKNLLRC